MRILLASKRSAALELFQAKFTGLVVVGEKGTEQEHFLHLCVCGGRGGGASGASLKWLPPHLSLLVVVGQCASSSQLFVLGTITCIVLSSIPLFPCGLPRESSERCSEVVMHRKRTSPDTNHAGFVAVPKLLNAGIVTVVNIFCSSNSDSQLFFAVSLFVLSPV